MTKACKIGAVPKRGGVLVGLESLTSTLECRHDVAAKVSPPVVVNDGFLVVLHRIDFSALS